MAVGDYTTEALLRSIKRRMLMPTATATYDDEDLLEIADEEAQTYVVPVIRAINEEHLVDTYEVDLDGETSFEIPPQASGESLREVALDDGNGGWVKLDRVDIAPPAYVVTAFYLQDDAVVLTGWPTSSGATRMRMKFWRRPSKLVLPERCRLVTSAGASSLGYASTGEAPPFVSDDELQVVQSEPGFRLVLGGLVADGPGGLTAQAVDTITADEAASTVGNWLCLADESCVPQLPREAHALLAQAVATAVLFGRDAANYAASLAKRGEMEASMRTMLAQRTQGAPLHIVNLNAPGWGWGRGRRW